MVNLKSETIILSDDTKVIKETTTKFYLKLGEKENIYLQLSHTLNNSLRRWVPETELHQNWCSQIGYWKTFLTRCQTSKLTTLKNMTNIEMKISSITKIQYFNSDQPHTQQLKRTLLKTPEKSTHTSQSTKHLYPLTLEGDTLLQLHKFWDFIRCAYWKSLYTNNVCPTYKQL